MTWPELFALIILAGFVIVLVGDIVQHWHAKGGC